MDTLLYRKEAGRGITAALTSVDAAVLDETVAAVKAAPRVFFTGAGRSFLMMQAVAMCFMQIGLTSYVTGGVTTPAIGEGDLLIAASCSGETKSVALFVEQAKAMGAKIILITSNEESVIAKMADIVIRMEGRSEKGSVQETWLADARFEHAIVPLGDCLMEAIARSQNASDNIIKEHHANME